MQRFLSIFLFMCVSLLADGLTPGQRAIEQNAPKPEQHATISIVALNGQEITLSDNSVWEVAPHNRSTARGWIAGADPVMLKRGRGEKYPYVMKNLQTNQVIRVRALPQ